MTELRDALRKALLETGVIDDGDGTISYWTDTADGSFCGSPDLALDALEREVLDWVARPVEPASPGSEHWLG